MNDIWVSEIVFLENNKTTTRFYILLNTAVTDVSQDLFSAVYSIRKL